MSITSYLNEMLEDFSQFDSKFDLLEYIIEFGKELTPLDKEDLIEKNKVKGCTSNVFLKCTLNDGKVYCKAQSEALIVGGYIAILLQAINGKSKDEILEHKQEIENFVVKAGIKKNLTPTRASAFSNILELLFSQIKNL
jgi:cysteine desulfuration protein SufE